MVTEIVTNEVNLSVAAAPGSSFALAPLPAKSQGLLMRMFSDPYLLEKEDRATLVQDLRDAVVANPHSSDLRVVLGMALCVNFEVEAAIDQLETGVALAPSSFIAQLKLGELWMRLRVCEKAEAHTREAALLARNMMQSELARKQAAALRTLMHNGVIRGGSSKKRPWQVLAGFRKFLKRSEPESEALALAETP